jgi:hypothetical protein
MSERNRKRAKEVRVYLKIDFRPEIHEKNIMYAVSLKNSRERTGREKQLSECSVPKRFRFLLRSGKCKLYIYFKVLIFLSIT